MTDVQQRQDLTHLLPLRLSSIPYPQVRLQLHHSPSTLDYLVSRQLKCIQLFRHPAFAQKANQMVFLFLQEAGQTQVGRV